MRQVEHDIIYNFPFYAEKILKIRPKDGGLKPFKLNAVQEIIHAKLEQQIAETGMVRAIILKRTATRLLHIRCRQVLPQSSASDGN